jgi:hypothetical protein
MPEAVIGMIVESRSRKKGAESQIQPLSYRTNSMSKITPKRSCKAGRTFPTMMYRLTRAKAGLRMVKAIEETWE